ncbi:MAG: serine/threonine protein kinase [Anaerolineaceae bacterium]
MAIHIGDVLKDRYKIIESLGRGGMADVYKVWDEERSTYLALKLLRDDLAQDPVFMRRFRREAHNLAQLQHPNIVRFYGLDEDDLKAFILMEYIEGPTLREEIRRAGAGGLALECVQSIMEDVCSALQYAHNKGLVHCDIKSGNILIDASGKAYLTDFGIARGMDAATSTMVGVGTPAYMAPELIKGEDPTPQTDIYALGIVLYEMLTGGERPFTGERATITGTTAEKVRWEHLNMNPTPVAQFNPGTAASFEIIIEKCLEKIARDRYAGVQDLIDSITALTVKDLSDLQDQEQEKRKYSDVELNREKKDVVEYREEKEETRGKRTGMIVGILMLCIGILILIGNYRASTQNTKITETKPITENVAEITATQIDVLEPTATSEEESRQITPLPTLKKITQGNVNGLQEINRTKVSNNSIESMDFADDGDSVWVLDNVDFISLSTQSLGVLKRIDIPDQYDEDEVYLNSTYHVLGSTIYSNSDSKPVFEIPEGNVFIDFSEDNSSFFTYFPIDYLGNYTDYWKVKAWALYEERNTCNTSELSSYNRGRTLLVNEGKNFITSEREIREITTGYDYEYKNYISLWNSANCRKIDSIIIDNYRYGQLYPSGDSVIWSGGEAKLIIVDDGKLVVNDISSIGLKCDSPSNVRSLIIKSSDLLIISHENRIEFRDLKTLSLIDSFTVNEEISSITSNNEETILLVGTKNGSIIQYGVFQ